LRVIMTIVSLVGEMTAPKTPSGSGGREMQAVVTGAGAG
jgi:hypothetical protein